VCSWPDDIFVVIYFLSGKAIAYLEGKLGIVQTTCCGDSGSDVQMLHPDRQCVLVGNSDRHLVEFAESKLHGTFYKAKNWYAAGVLEGLAHFDNAASTRKRKSML
jgi:hydroxymethylpyrimidine pyrophosphatase-like HAD family hydrolase